MISSRNAASSVINDLRGRKNCLLDEPIAIVLDSNAIHYIDSPANDQFKLVFHFHRIEEIPFCILLIRCQEVDIAFRAEVVAKDGSEDAKFLNFPPLAELAYCA